MTCATPPRHIQCHHGQGREKEQIGNDVYLRGTEGEGASNFLIHPVRRSQNDTFRHGGKARTESFRGHRASRSRASKKVSLTLARHIPRAILFFMKTTEQTVARMMKELQSDLADMVERGELTDEQANEWANMKADQWAQGGAS